MTCPLEMLLQEQMLWGMHEQVSVAPQDAGRGAQYDAGQSAWHPGIWYPMAPQPVRKVVPLGQTPPSGTA
jgi:hypothetical protein